MATQVTINKNVRANYNFRLTFTLPSALLSLMGFQESYSERLSLLITEAQIPSDILDKIEYPTGTGKAYVAGLSYIGDNISLKHMQVDDTLTSDPLTDALARFGVNNFFWFWQKFANWNSVSTSEAEAIFAQLRSNPLYTTGVRPPAFSVGMSPGRGNLPSTYKLTGTFEVLTPSQGQATEVWFLQGLFPTNVKKGDVNRNASELFMSDVELSIDNQTPALIA